VFVIEIFLPLTDNDGRPFSPDLYATARQALTERFGGLTVYSRAPAAGLWARDDTVVRDDIVIFEVMAKQLDTEWWTQYRLHLQAAFRQDSLLIRARDTIVI
jgi:hypothetical protein